MVKAILDLQERASKIVQLGGCDMLVEMDGAMESIFCISGRQVSLGDGWPRTLRIPAQRVAMRCADLIARNAHPQKRRPRRKPR